VQLDLGGGLRRLIPFALERGENEILRVELVEGGSRMVMRKCDSLRRRLRLPPVPHRYPRLPASRPSAMRL
jgi:hypothetical protein